MIRSFSKSFRTDYEILNINEQVIYYGKGKFLSAKIEFFDANGNYAFNVMHTGIFKRIFFLKKGSEVLSQVVTKSIFFKKKFSFTHHGKNMEVVTKGNWRDTTFYDEDVEIAKINRTNKGIFSKSKYAVAMNTKYEPAIILGVVVILNQIKTLQEQGS